MVLCHISGTNTEEPKICTEPRSPILKLNNQTWKIIDEFAELVVSPENPIKIKLASYVIKMVDGARLGSVTVTPNKMIVSYSKTIQDTIPDGCVDIDMNFDNITMCDTDGNMTGSSQ